MRRFVLALLLALCVAAIAPGGTGAKTSRSAFRVLVEPTTSAASNGLTLQTELKGSFDAADKTARGHGDYVVKNGGTVLEQGTFTLTRLVTFQFYGCGLIDGIPLPPDFCGGRATFAFHSTSSTGNQRDGLIEVNCQIHGPGGKTPPGTSEGVKVNARGINFNRHVTGDNLFRMLP